MASRAWMMLSAFVGAGAALLTSAIMRSSENASRADTHFNESKEPLRPAPASRSIIAQAELGRLEALEQEVGRLGNQRGELPSAMPAQAPDPEQERTRVAARFSDLERRLQADPVDPSWSSGATASLHNDISAASRRYKFSLLTAECRTEMCRATLQWDNYAAAVKTGTLLALRAIPGLNCVKNIWLKEPADPSVPYSSELYLECSGQRAGTVDNIPATEESTTEEAGRNL